MTTIETHGRALDSGGLTPMQRQVIAAYCTGTSWKEIARQLDMPRSTLSAWRRDPRYAAALEEALEEVRVTAGQRLRANLGRLVDEAIRLALDPETTDSAKVRMLTTLIDRGSEVEDRPGRRQGVGRLLRDRRVVEALAELPPEARAATARVLGVLADLEAEDDEGDPDDGEHTGDGTPLPVLDVAVEG